MADVQNLTITTLAIMQSIRDSHSLLVGMQNWKTAVENNLPVSYKTKQPH